MRNIIFYLLLKQTYAGEKNWQFLYAMYVEGGIGMSRLINLTSAIMKVNCTFNYEI